MGGGGGWGKERGGGKGVGEGGGGKERGVHCAARRLIDTLKERTTAVNHPEYISYKTMHTV